MPCFFRFRRLGFELDMHTGDRTSPKISFAAKGPVLELGRMLGSIRRFQAYVLCLLWRTEWAEVHSCCCARCPRNALSMS